MFQVSNRYYFAMFILILGHSASRGPSTPGLQKSRLDNVCRKHRLPDRLRVLGVLLPEMSRRRRGPHGQGREEERMEILQEGGQTPPNLSQNS